MRQAGPRQAPVQAAAHAKLVELTWDTIATFMTPVAADDVTPTVSRRLNQIARACLPDCSGRVVVDVGCGHGLLLPSLLEAGLDSADFVGYDVSKVMLDVADAAFGATGAKFVHGGFDAACESPDAAHARAVCFNGALQFFADPASTLRRAAQMLAPGGRVVVSHVNGAAFVRDERQGNPATVLSAMPSLDELEQVAASLAEAEGIELRVLPPAELGSSRKLDDFYLVALERQA